MLLFTQYFKNNLSIFNFKNIQEPELWLKFLGFFFLKSQQVWQPWLAFAHNSYQLWLVVVQPWAEPAFSLFIQLQLHPSAHLGYLSGLCLRVSGFMNLIYSHICNYNRKILLIITIISGIFQESINQWLLYEKADEEIVHALSRSRSLQVLET